MAHLTDAIETSGDKAVPLNEEGMFSTTFELLNAYHPMPAELIGTKSVLISQPQLSNLGETPMGENLNNERLRDMYGFQDWYGWCIANWGTKWDVDELFINPEEQWLSFHSAWSPPVEWLKKVSQDFPATRFRIAYCEGGNHYAGYQTIQDGRELEEFIFIEEWWERVEGEDESYEMTQALDNFLTEHNLRGVGG